MSASRRLPDPIEVLNLENRYEMEQIADKQRETLIMSSFRAAKFLWEKQDDSFNEIAANGFPEDAVYEFYVVPAFDGFPFNENQPVTSMAILVKPEQPASVDTDDGEHHDQPPIEPDQSQMIIYVEVPDDTVFDETLDIESLPDPKRIAIDLTTPNGHKMSYVIDMTGTSPFINARDSGDEAVEMDSIEEEHEAQFFGKDSENDGSRAQIKIDVELIPKILKNLTDWKAQIQKKIPLSEMSWNRPPLREE